MDRCSDRRFLLDRCLIIKSKQANKQTKSKTKNTLNQKKSCLHWLLMNTKAIFGFFLFMPFLIVKVGWFYIALLFSYYRKDYYLHPGIGLFHPIFDFIQTETWWACSKVIWLCYRKAKQFLKRYTTMWAAWELTYTAGGK